MKLLNFKDFMIKNILKSDTMNKSQMQKIYNLSMYPRDGKVYSDKGFVNIDNGSIGGAHWTCFCLKDKKLNYFNSFGGHPEKFLLNHLPKPIIYHKYKKQDLNSKLCGSYCWYFF